MQYDFNLSPNGAQFIDVKGKFFKYKNGAGKIRVRNSNGGYIDLLPGQGVSGLNYSSLSITDISGAANSGYLLAGDYEFSDDTVIISGGSVAVTSAPAVTGSVGIVIPGFASALNIQSSVNVGVTLVSGASNNKGVNINRVAFAGTSTGMILTVIAKFGTPTSVFDGDILDIFSTTGVSSYLNANPIFVIPGKTIALFSNLNEATMTKSILYTIL